MLLFVACRVGYIWRQSRTAWIRRAGVPELCSRAYRWLPQWAMVRPQSYWLGYPLPFLRSVLVLRSRNLKRFIALPTANHIDCDPRDQRLHVQNLTLSLVRLTFEQCHETTASFVHNLQKVSEYAKVKWGRYQLSPQHPLMIVGREQATAQPGI